MLWARVSALAIHGVPLSSSLRTYEMLSLYFQGWADLEELTAHLEKLRQEQKTS